MTTDTLPSVSLPGLLRELRDETTTLLRQEVALAKAELKDSADQFENHVVRMATAGLVVYAGVVVMLIGLGLLLGANLAHAGMDPTVALWLSEASIGVLVTLFGVGMLARAKKAIESERVARKKTFQSMRESKEWAEAKLQKSS